ncbi:MAG: LLM class flavin-dependent oxidoreductase [Anaerolineae bacterium]|nr:LLM class flavin-dependent oxidoreductase [Anaerolineae bacterium]
MDASISFFPSKPIQELIQIVQYAEAAGYSKCYANEEGVNGKDLYVTLTALAGATHTIKLGPGFTNPFVRHPAITASAMLSLDEFSNKRAFLGLTTGGILTLGPLGITPEKPVETLRETILLLRRLFRGERITAVYQDFRLCSAQLIDAGRDMEIWIAGRSPKILKSAGELADGVVLGPICKHFLGDYIRYIRDGAEISGNSPKICLSMEIVTTDEEFDELRSRMVSNIADSSAEVKKTIGLSSDEAERIKKLIASGSLQEAGKALKDEWITPFVIMGSETQCERELKDLIKQHKIDEFQVRIPWRDPEKRLKKLANILQSI